VPGFVPGVGAGGFGLFALGMGEPGSVEVPSSAPEGGWGFFHGFAESFEVAMPGKTATGLAEELAVWATAGVAGGSRRLGGGGGAGMALGFGGTSSK
jgi:hypothetical protein